MTATARGGARLGAALVVGLVFLAVAWVALRDTSIVTPPQGREYVRTAASIAAGDGFEQNPGEPMVRFAPLYPLLLAPFAGVGLDVVASVYLLNCLALTGCLLGFYWLARELGLRGAGPAAAVFALWAGHYYLLRAVRADGLAVCLTVLAMAALVRYGRSLRRVDLGWVALLGALAATSRYMTALALLPVLVVGVAVLSAGSARTRWLRGCATGLVAGLPILIWVARNVALTGYAFGMSRTVARPMAEGSDLPTNAFRLGKTLLIDLFATDAMGTFPVIVGELAPARPGWIGIAAAAAVAAIVVAVFRCPRERLRDLFRSREIVGIALFPACYVVLLLVLWTVGNNDPIHTRFVTPVYPFLALAGLALATRAASDRLALGALALAAALVLVPSSIKCAGLLSERPDQKLLELQGRKKTRDRWHDEVPWDAGRKWLDEGD
jgi:4-amino-4-deoxy-L-arabinose transferase-like glycosyltransferase